MTRTVAVWMKMFLAAVALSSLCGCGEPPEQARREKKRARKVRRIADAKPAAHGMERKEKKSKKKKLSKKERRALRKRRMKEYARRQAEVLRAVDESLPPEERSIAIGLRDGLDNEDLAAVAKFSVMARTSKVSGVRQQAVSALNWFGKRALPNLTAYLNDPDEDVASEARMAWENGISEIEDDSIMRQYLETAMTMISDREMLDSLAMNFNGMEDQGAAVESLVRIIESGNEAGVAAAKETYEFITGDPWSGKASALKWAAENHPQPEE